MKVIKEIALGIIAIIWGGIIVLGFTDAVYEILHDYLHLSDVHRLDAIAGIAIGAITIYLAVMGYRALTKEIPRLKDEIRELNYKLSDCERELSKYKKEEAEE